jgi:PhnB protein
MQLVPYVNYNGNCREAFEHYAMVLRTEAPQFVTHEDMPMEDSSIDWKDMILHAHLQVGSFSLAGSDTPPDWYAPPASMYVLLQVDTPDEAERIYADLSKDASIQMEIGQQPWAQRFSMLTDRFGTPWIINCD